MKAFLFLLFIALIVALNIWFPKLMLNPGKLSEGHQKIEKKCTACHQPFWGIRDAKCISCHQPDEISKKSSAGNTTSLDFHKALKKQACTSCHTDHKGLDPDLATMNFEHDALSLTIRNNCSSCHEKPVDSLHAQLSVSCGSCHNTNDWKFTGSFDHDLITGINKTNCVACHKKPVDDLHQSVQNNCMDCHSTSKWSPATFDHAEYFVLDRDHNVNCNTCHTDKASFKTYTCYGCHEHSEPKIAREHQEEGITDFADCASCHRSSDKHDIRSGKNERNGELRNYIESESRKQKKEHDD